MVVIHVQQQLIANRSLSLSSRWWYAKTWISLPMGGCGEFRKVLHYSRIPLKKLFLLQQHCHCYIIKLFVDNIVSSWACWVHFELRPFHVGDWDWSYATIWRAADCRSLCCLALERAKGNVSGKRANSEKGILKRSVIGNIALLRNPHKKCWNLHLGINQIANCTVALKRALFGPITANLSNHHFDGT